MDYYGLLLHLKDSIEQVAWTDSKGVLEATLSV